MIRHHKDGNKHNNDASNIEILQNQKEHCFRHKNLNINWNKLIVDLNKQDKVVTAIKLKESLNQFFTAAQQYIIMRKVYGLPLNKTEKEVFSRQIKKKLIALAHPGLHNIVNSFILFI
jgi:hypothetical protein